MSEAKRIEPKEAREELQSSDEALLVCAYDDDEKCEKIALEESISYSTFVDKRDDVSRDAAIIFY